jgi:hypothetical protein
LQHCGKSFSNFASPKNFATEPGKVTIARWLLCAAAGELRRVDRKQHSRRVVAKINRFAQMIIEFVSRNQPTFHAELRQAVATGTARVEFACGILRKCPGQQAHEQTSTMRWSPKGAQRVLQTRVAVLDGRLQDGRLSLVA